MSGADQKTPNMDQVVAALWKMPDQTHLARRVTAVNNAQSELFAAADVILEWLKTIRVEDRPLARFNRLQDAINSVREAHQMEPPR